MNQNQTNSIVRTVLKIAGAWLLQHGLTTQASLVNSPDVCGLIVLLIGFWQSHQAHTNPMIADIVKFALGPQPVRGGDGPSPLPAVPVETMLANATAQLAKAPAPKLAVPEAGAPPNVTLPTIAGEPRPVPALQGSALTAQS